MSLALGLGMRLGNVRGGGLAGPVLDLDWATGQDYSKLSVTSTSAGSTTGAWIKSNLGLYEAKPSGYPAHLEGCRVVSSAPAWTDAGGGAITNAIWRGPAPSATNLALYSRDLTNAAWTKTNVTAAKTATGIDGAANSATTLTATAGNGTCTQAITSASSARRTSAFIKRRTGSGTIEMTQDGGTTWTAVTVTSSFVRLDIPVQTLTNPTIGLRIVTSGDAIDVDVVQHETGSTVTGPIVTTSGTVSRIAETIAYPHPIGNGWTAVVGVDLSGLSAPPNATTILSAGNDAPLFTEIPANEIRGVINGNYADGTYGPDYTGSTQKVGARYLSGVLTLKADAVVTPSFTTGLIGANTSTRIGSGVTTNAQHPIKTVKIWDRALDDTEFADA